MAYAAKTEVPVEKSQADIKTLLRKWGADHIGIFESPDNAKLVFILQGRQIRFDVPLPEGTQALRSRWRALLLILRGKLEAIESGIVTIESEFLAQTVLPDGQTAGAWMKPQLALAYKEGKMPDTLLLEGPKS